jgi:hypothetical protein
MCSVSPCGATARVTRMSGDSEGGWEEIEKGVREKEMQMAGAA